MQENFAVLVVRLLEKAEKILKEYPLCNSCLGRLFARHGVGLGNYERGLMVKTLLAMKLHNDYAKGVADRDSLKVLAAHAGDGIASMYRKLFSEDVAVDSCYLCGGKLGRELVERIAGDVCVKLKEYGASKFLIGVTISNEVLGKELELIIKHGVESSESIKREIKREVGKAVMALCNATPQFSSPEVVLIVNLDSTFNYEISVQSNPLFYAGRYRKLGRRISHIPWYTETGVKKYPLSVQEAVERVFKKIFEAEEVVIHAAGREDVDTRMVGSGRPVIVEVKSPRRRGVDVDALRLLVEGELRSLNVPVELRITSTASRGLVTLIKEHSKRKRKTYRVVIYSQEGIEVSELKRLEEFFENREVRQRTPLRILRCKKDRVRARKVYTVKTLQVSDKVFEALVLCEGGLYVKELVHCDDGRTTPCFAGILGKALIPIELDVIYVEE
ncbi:MAG: tRNA pseudouridine(54/55) synthase Pus10 [Desulfurococcaceae archaeon]